MVEDDRAESQGGGNDSVQVAPDPEPEARAQDAQGETFHGARDQTTASFQYLSMWRAVLLSNEVHRNILIALSDADLLEAMNGLYRMIALMMAEIVNTVEHARHVRDHKGGDDVAMVQTEMSPEIPKALKSRNSP